MGKSERSSNQRLEPQTFTMRPLKAILLMQESCSRRVCQIAEQAGFKIEETIVTEERSLLNAFSLQQELLLSFGTSVIVPEHILKIPGLLALNVHAGSPQYPGRDPHHFAVYERAKQYGATMHFMEKKVDNGAIIDCELFDVAGEITPKELLSKANNAGWVLIERFFNKFKNSKIFEPIDVSWGKRKTTRAMFRQMCCVDPSISKEELERRLIAFEVPGHQNISLKLHNYRFRFEGKN